RDEVRREIRVERLLGGLVVRNDFERGVPGKRYHLGDDDAVAIGAEFAGERVGADEGDVDEGGIKTLLVGELDELGAWPVGTDHDDGFRLAALDDPERRSDRSGIALKRAFGGQLQAAPCKRALDAG